MNTQAHKRIFHSSQISSKFDEIFWKIEQRGIKITVIISTWNNEGTIGRTIILLQAEKRRHSFLKEIIVVDNDSTDNTREIATSFGAVVHRSSEILPELNKKPGKGVRQWKALSKAQGDIIVFIDGGSKIQPNMVYALVAPLILEERTGTYP
ncbi:MAG: glycosyltransferase [Deltaproteobacteria bacterium]|nr:glycosyltransferase [Deltaproteobacteria bacterium]